MSDIKVEGYKVTGLILWIQVEKDLHVILQTSEILAALAQVFEGYNDAERAAQLKKVCAPFSLSLVPSPSPPASERNSTEQRHFRVSGQERRRTGGVVDHRLEEDGHGEEGRGKDARLEAGRDGHPVRRDFCRHRGRQDDGTKGVHDWGTEDERKHDARDETRWCPQGTLSLANLCCRRGMLSIFALEH